MKIEKKYIIVAILLMTIGFAAVSTTLILNGTINLGFNRESFDKDVIFTRAETDEGGSASIVEEGKKITFTSKILSKVGEIATLDFDITNKSLDYDADVTIACTLVSNIYADYVRVTPNSMQYELAAQEVVTDNLKVTLIKPYLGEESVDAEFSCTLTPKPKARGKRATTSTTTTTQPVEYKETLLKGAEPTLTDSLIPITLSNDGTVTMADVYNKWYDYENKEWANAVILKNNPSKQYKAGDTISENDIESYFVWIPRFKYQLFHVSQANSGLSSKPSTSSKVEIQVEFEGKETEVSKGTQNGEWLTHPAFTNFNTNGIWVGKFETGKDNNGIIIKPNISSWRNTTHKNFFITSLNYKKEFNSHMMKNTEWGAVAYLSQSKYGAGSGVNVNNNSNYITGYSAVTAPTCETKDADCNKYGNSEDITLPYNTSTGYKASTTGNITGIYDMAGGASECMAAYSSNYGASDSSGFTDAELTQYAKYFDVYPEGTIVFYFGKRILGDATGEMGPFYNAPGYSMSYRNTWYDDLSHMMDPPYPWLSRGGIYYLGTAAGILAFNRTASGTTDEVGSRLVLAY